MQKPETAEEYMKMAEQLTALVDAELTRTEKDVQNGDMHLVVQRMPGLISLVNTIGYLRGQDGLFLEVRPSDVSLYQKELYATEDAMESRLWSIIERICGVSEDRERYIHRLREYFLEWRTPREYRTSHT